MKRSLFCFLLAFPVIVFGQKNYVGLVNPFIGTGGHGHTFPGASMPFGMMQLSPDSRGADWDGSSGYHYSDTVIYGFSHTHLSGTGIPDYCDVLLMPFTGTTPWTKEAYRSTFSHNDEKASPGYYEVLLQKDNIRAALTTSYHSGMHRYSFAKSTAGGGVLIDLKHRDEVLDSRFEQISATEIQGYRKSRSWAQNQQLYFYIRFDSPIEKLELRNETGMLAGKIAEGKDVKAALHFAIRNNQVIARVGISAVSIESAKKNLEAEIAGQSFESIHSKAVTAWNKELSKIDIKGGTRDQQVCFYTALYHSFLVPNIFQDVDGNYRGTDGKIHTAKGYNQYTVFSLWDTYRAYHPLMTILNPGRTRDWIHTFLAQYKDGGMLPVWELAGNETFCMIGYHSVPVIWDAYQKGIRDFDTKLALEAMRSYAESNRFGLEAYRNDGYISNEKEHESVSKTLEYAYDDWCIASFAKALNDTATYNTYIKRAQQYKNVFDASTGHMRGKVEGRWYRPFEPREINNFFTEGNSWQYSFAVPQDLATLIKLHGGKDGFRKKLDQLFTTSSQTTGREQADVTGLIGQYAQGNEPSHHMAYLYNYLGEPSRTQELIDRILYEFYTNSPDGLIGNEDCGQMSAWYILSALGFYPVCPGTGEYVLGTPLFDEAVIHLENGRQFTISAKRQNQRDHFITGISLNGRAYKPSYLNHSDLMKGGRFDITLSSKPGTWGTAIGDLPHSEIKATPIVPVPFLDLPSNKFRDTAMVVLRNLEAGTEIFYSIGSGAFVQYNKPFALASSTVIKAYAARGNERSKTITQHLFKAPSDRTITVISKVHPMYVGDGPDGLIDGILGNENWRAGEWQSYFDQDFQAIVDLKQVRPVQYVGVHVLQDVSPWIVYPGELQIYSSEDGKNFTLVKTVKNAVGNDKMGVQTQQLGSEVSARARYIKVVAVNGGKLPAWHESAGSPTHLFIDEIVVK